MIAAIAIAAALSAAPTDAKVETLLKAQVEKMYLIGACERYYPTSEVNWYLMEWASPPLTAQQVPAEIAALNRQAYEQGQGDASDPAFTRGVCQEMLDEATAKVTRATASFERAP